MTIEEQQHAIALAVEHKTDENNEKGEAMAELDFLQEYWEEPDNTLPPKVLKAGRNFRLTVFWVSIFGIQIEEVSDED